MGQLLMTQAPTTFGVKLDFLLIFPGNFDALCLWLGACFLVHLVLNLKHTRKKKDEHVLEMNADACFFK